MLFSSKSDNVNCLLLTDSNSAPRLVDHPYQVENRGNGADAAESLNSAIRFSHFSGEHRI
jgi:hypothetical protein